MNPRHRGCSHAALILLVALAGCATQPESPPASTAPPPAATPTAEPAAPSPPPTPPPPPPVTAQSELEQGIKSYEDGDYKSATKFLHSALELGLTAPTDQARAHKYLAFMVCVNGREKACRDEFRKALEADPAFALKPAEASHPVWPQVVRSVKAELAREAKKKKK
jgi:Tfp pilus assembly protein PilF